MAPIDKHNPSTQYEAIVEMAAAQMADKAPLPEVAAAAEAAGVPGDIAAGLFPTPEALTEAVVEHAVVRLVDTVTVATSRAAPGDPVAQLRAMAHAVVGWAFDNINDARLLISLPALRFADGEMVDRYNRSIYDLARQMAVRAQEEGRLDPRADIGELLLTLRCLTLGMATLEAIEQAQVWVAGRETRAALLDALDAYLDLRFPAPGAAPPQPIRSDA